MSCTGVTLGGDDTGRLGHVPITVASLAMNDVCPYRWESWLVEPDSLIFVYLFLNVKKVCLLTTHHCCAFYVEYFPDTNSLYTTIHYRHYNLLMQHVIFYSDLVPVPPLHCLKLHMLKTMWKMVLHLSPYVPTTFPHKVTFLFPLPVQTGAMITAARNIFNIDRPEKLCCVFTKLVISNPITYTHMLQYIMFHTLAVWKQYCWRHGVQTESSLLGL